MPISKGLGFLKRALVRNCMPGPVPLREDSAELCIRVPKVGPGKGDVCVYMHTCTLTYIHICVCIYVYTHTHTGQPGSTARAYYSTRPCCQPSTLLLRTPVCWGVASGGLYFLVCSFNTEGKKIEGKHERNVAVGYLFLNKRGMACHQTKAKKAKDISAEIKKLFNPLVPFPAKCGKFF